MQPEEKYSIMLGDISESITDVCNGLKELNSNLAAINRTLSELVEESHGIYTYCISINNTLDKNKRYQ